MAPRSWQSAPATSSWAPFSRRDRQPGAGPGTAGYRDTRLPSRAVGELAANPRRATGLLGRDRFTGYENHAGYHPRAGVEPLALVPAGVGNGDGTEGAVSGHTIGTYLHGPCLVRNPDIADQLLEWAVGTPLEPVDEPEVTALRAERFRTVLRG